jgi:hypothetical protein
MTFLQWNSAGNASSLLFSFLKNLLLYHCTMGTAVSQSLRYCATNQKVAGLIPDGVIGFFRWHNRSDCTMVLGSNQRLNKNEYQKYILGGKGGRFVGLTTLPPYCAVVKKSGNLNFLESSGPLQACNGIALPLPYIHIYIIYVRKTN